MRQTAVCAVILSVVSGCAGATTTNGTGPVEPTLVATAGQASGPPSTPKPPATAEQPDSVPLLRRTAARIETPLSSGAGWVCEEKEYQDPISAFVSKCQREQENLVLLAKVYEVPRDQVTTPKVLVNEIYPRNYKKMFTTFNITSTNAEKIGPHEAMSVFVDAVDNDGPVKVHERVICDGTLTFLLTEVGSPKAFETFKADRERWFADTKFRDLRQR